MAMLNNQRIINKCVDDFRLKTAIDIDKGFSRIFHCHVWLPAGQDRNRGVTCMTKTMKQSGDLEDSSIAIEIGNDHFKIFEHIWTHHGDFSFFLSPISEQGLRVFTWIAWGAWLWSDHHRRIPMISPFWYPIFLGCHCLVLTGTIAF